MKTSVRGLSLIASLAALAFAAPAIAAVYAPIEDAELLRRASTVVVARAAGSTVVATPGGLPETRTTFTAIDSLAGSDEPYFEVAVPGGELPGGLTLALEGAPRFSPGGLYVLALNARADGAFVPTELGLGVFDVVQDEAGRTYATRAMFRSERVAVLQREADGSLSERREPLRELAAFTSYVRAALYRAEPLAGAPAYVVRPRGGQPEAGAPGRRLGPVGRPLVPERRSRVVRRELRPLSLGGPDGDGALGRRGHRDLRPVGRRERRVDRAPERHRALGERPEQHDQLFLRRSSRRDGQPGRDPCRRDGARLLRRPVDVRRNGVPVPVHDGRRPRHERRGDRPVVARLQGDVVQDHPRGHRLGPPRRGQLRRQRRPVGALPDGDGERPRLDARPDGRRQVAQPERPEPRRRQVRPDGLELRRGRVAVPRQRRPRRHLLPLRRLRRASGGIEDLRSVRRPRGRAGRLDVLVGDGPHEPLGRELDRDHPVHAFAGCGRRVW